MGTVWAVIVAAGDGRRFGRPKQFETLAGRLVVEWSADVARLCADGVVLVLPADRVDDPSVRAGADRVVAGGASRSASVRAGLAALPDDADVVVIHDAARPLASEALFVAVVEAVRAGSPGAIPGVPVTDTVKRVRGELVAETLDRNELVAVQTPQAFSVTALRRAHVGDPDATDDAALLELAGDAVAVVPGEVSNRKLTELDDLAWFEQMLLQRAVR